MYLKRLKDTQNKTCTHCFDLILLDCKIASFSLGR